MLLTKGKLKSALLGVAASAFMAACAHVPAPKDMRAEKNSQNFATQASLKSENSDVSIANWPKKEWWRDVHDPQLDDLIAKALINNPNIAIANDRIKKALGIISIIDEGAPNFDIRAGLNFDKQTYNSAMPAAYIPHGIKDYEQITANYSKDLDLWGRKAHDLAAARSNLAAIEVDGNLARIAISTSIANEYARLGALYFVRDEMSQNVELKQEALSLFQKRFKGGMDNAIRAKQAQSELAMAQLTLSQHDEKIALSKAAIANLVGLGPDIAQSINRPTAKGVRNITIPNDLSLNLLARRGDVIAARLRVMAAGEDVASKTTSYYPNVTFSGNIGLSSMGIGRLLDGGSFITQFGPAISMPIFAQKSLDNNLNDKRNDYNLAVDQYNATINAAFAETAQIITSIKYYDAQLIAARAAYEASEGAANLLQKRYSGGLATRMDVLAAKSNALSARQNLTIVETHLTELKLALIKALGGGFNE